MSKKIDYFDIKRMSNSSLKNYKNGWKRGEHKRKQYIQDKINGITKYAFYIGNYFDFLINLLSSAPFISTNMLM